MRISVKTVFIQWQFEAFITQRTNYQPT